MRQHRTALLFGTAVGAALGTAALAALTAGSATADPADPVGTAWPFGDFQLPGVSVGADLTGWPVLTGVEPYTDAGGDYSAQFTGIEVPFVGYLIHREVFDSANPSAPDGTTWDGISLPFFSDTVIASPGVGIGEQIALGSLTNNFIADTAGIQDVVSLGDYPPVTLFDIPVDLGALMF